jgi:hypothetical protein
MVSPTGFRTPCLSQARRFVRYVGLGGDHSTRHTAIRVLGDDYGFEITCYPWEEGYDKQPNVPSKEFQMTTERPCPNGASAEIRPILEDLSTPERRLLSEVLRVERENRDAQQPQKINDDIWRALTEIIQ